MRGRAAGRTRRPTAFVVSACCGLTLLAAGCEGRDAAPGEPLVRDSAGVTIVELPAGADLGAPEWRVDPLPALEIGVVEGEEPYQFGNLAGVARLSDGVIAVVEQITRELRLFGPGGAHLRSLGGMGDGPGEFNLPTGPFLLGGDTLAIWDLNHRRFTFFTSGGELAGTLTPPAVPFNIVGAVGGRRFVVSGGTATVRPGDPEAVLRNESVVQLVDLADAEQRPDTIAVVSDLLLFRWSRNGMFGFTPVPFSARASVAVGAGWVAVTAGDRSEVKVYDDEGRLARIIRELGEPEPLELTRFRAEVERRVAATANEELRPEIRRRHAEMPVPGTVPVYSRLLLGADGEIWAERFRPDRHSGGYELLDEPSIWTVFAPSGGVAGTVTLPPRFTLHQPVPEAVLGVHRDEFEVQYVRVLRIER